MKKLFAATIAFFMPIVAKAQDLGGGLLTNVAVKNAGYKTTPIEQMVGSIIRIALDMIGVVFLVLIVYGGYVWMIARGDEAMVEKAKDTIINSTIGLAITLAAYGITYYVVNRLTESALK
jgi:hypothetical protein